MRAAETLVRAGVALGVFCCTSGVAGSGLASIWLAFGSGEEEEVCRLVSTPLFVRPCCLEPRRSVLLSISSGRDTLASRGTIWRACGHSPQYASDR